MEKLKIVEIYFISCTILNSIVATKVVASGLLIFFFSSQVAAAHIRYLNLLEYQSKALLESSGVAIQKFRVVQNVEEVKQLTQNFSE